MRRYVMRIAVLSDVHANFLALDAVYADMQAQRIDETVFLGDLVMTGPRPGECYSLLERMKPAVWIQGNTDNWLEEIDESFVPKDEKEAFQKSLNDYAAEALGKAQKENLIGKPISQDAVFGSVHFTFCHGTPTSFSRGLDLRLDLDELDSIAESCGAAVVCCGHTHTRLFMRHGNMSVCNFGSVSLPSGDDGRMARYGIIEIRGSGSMGFECRDIAYDIDAFFADMTDSGYPGLEFVRKKYGYAIHSSLEKTDRTA
ncbi:MAG: metallophosphoesterase [Spirochaetales bacterium]|nr:MAG: metallophosphoesterase [Spirochaetales bacterium]